MSAVRVLRVAPPIYAVAFFPFYMYNEPMTIILCLDDSGAMTFMNRRQSRDKAVAADIAASARGRLIIAPYSEKLFTAAGAEFLAVPDPFEEARGDDCVFIERGLDPARDLPAADRLVVYFWNRDYPHDPAPPLVPEEFGFRPAAELDFPGKSHEIITKRVYVRR